MARPGIPEYNRRAGAGRGPPTPDPIRDFRAAHGPPLRRTPSVVSGRPTGRPYAESPGHRDPGGCRVYGDWVRSHLVPGMRARELPCGVPGHRRSIRLKGFPYRSGATYFVTVCTAARSRVLSHVRDGQVHPTLVGSVVQEVWSLIPTRDPAIVLDAFVVMPDHIHGILTFGDEATTSLGRVMSWFKGVSLTTARNRRIWDGWALWQRGYFERIVRTQRALDLIRRYIHENPPRWTHP